MLSLYEPLRNEYAYNGETHSIDLAFDNVLRFYRLLEDRDFTNEEVVETAFEMFFGSYPKDADFALAAFNASCALLI